MTEQSGSATDSTDYEHVADIEISPGDTFLDLTDAEHQLIIVEHVGDVNKIAPDATVPDEHARRVDRSPEAVIAATDAPGDHVALDSQVFRRLVFEGGLRPVKRPKVMWALLHEAHRDELAAATDERGGEQ